MSKIFSWISQRVGLLTFTVLEFLALVLWQPRFTSAPVAAAIILTVGLFLEHIVSFNSFKGETNFLKLFKPHKVNAGKLLALSGLEMGIWAAWLGLVLLGHPILAFVVLFALMFVQHNAEVDTFLGRGAFNSLLNTRVSLFTLLEAVAGAVWLQLIMVGETALAAIVLFVGLLAEHHEQGEVLKDEAAV